MDSERAKSLNASKDGKNEAAQDCEKIDIMNQMAASAMIFEAPEVRPIKTSMTSRLSSGVVSNQKKPLSRLQKMAVENKLSNRLNFTPFSSNLNVTQSQSFGMNSLAGEETQTSIPCFFDDFVVSESDQFFGEGRFGIVKKCKRATDKRLFAVKEVRAFTSDDFDKACLENRILVRLNLVMEALNGMTLAETLEDDGADNEDMDDYLLNEQSQPNDANQSTVSNVEETKSIVIVDALGQASVDAGDRKRLLSQDKQDLVYLKQASMTRQNRRQSIRTPAVAGLKRSLAAQRKTHFTEVEARPLVREMLVAVQKMHKLGIVHRDLTPNNVFLHFPNLPAIQSPAQTKDEGAGDSSKSLDRFNLPGISNMVANPMDHIKNAHLKIIDFNHSRMFNLDDSPIKIRQRNLRLSDTMTEEQKWQQMCAEPSPALPRNYSPSPNRGPQGMTQQNQQEDDSQMDAAAMDNDGGNQVRSLNLMGTSAQQRKKPTSLQKSLKRLPGSRFRMFSPRVGTPMYRAPEILNRGQMYSESIDLWQAGCCIYFMLVGKSPFPEAAKEAVLNAQIKAGSFITERAHYQELSDQARTLICGLMNTNVLERLTIQQALDHQWLSDADCYRISDNEDSVSSASADSSSNSSNQKDKNQ